MMPTPSPTDPTFPAQLQAQLDRLGALGWSPNQIAAATGYTDRQLRYSWAAGKRPCKHALQVGLLAVLRSLKGKPPGQGRIPRNSLPLRSVETTP